MAYIQLQPTSPAANAVVTVDFARQHARINQNVTDELLWFYIQSATRKAENYLNRSLIMRSYSYSICHTAPPTNFPLIQIPFSYIPLNLEWIITHAERLSVELPCSPVANVTSVYYTEWSNATQVPMTLGTDYTVIYDTEPARVHLLPNCNISNNMHLTIQFDAGYGWVPEDVPIEIRHAILLMTTSYFEFRGDVETVGMPRAAECLLSDYRMFTLEAYF